jgi:8-oxo-dGTP pyrophosphatase MutT (NUDIX family)
MGQLSIGSELSEDEIRRLLIRAAGSQPGKHSHGWIPGEGAGLRSAAVLVPLFREDGEWKVLYTRRTDTVQDHKGQVSFPGGSTDPEDLSPYDTALREAYEEIGLHPEDVRILGMLGPMVTGTGFVITPVFGVIPWPYEFIPSPHEVSRIFSISLDWLAQPEHREERLFRREGVEAPPVWVYFYKEYDGENLWGVSAKITVNFIQALMPAEPPEIY